MAACDAVQAELSAYLDGEITADERSALDAHLRDCAACRAALAKLEGVQGELKALPKLKAPATLAANIRREMAAGSTVSGEDVAVSARAKIVPMPAPSRASMWGPGLVGVAALVMVGLLVFAVLPRISENRVESTAMKAANEPTKAKKDVAGAAPKTEEKSQTGALKDEAPSAPAAKEWDAGLAAGQPAEKSAAEQAAGLRSEQGESLKRKSESAELRKQLAPQEAPAGDDKNMEAGTAQKQPGRPIDAVPNLEYKKKSDESRYRSGGLVEGERVNRGTDPAKNADRVQPPAKAEASRPLSDGKPFEDGDGKAEVAKKSAGRGAADAAREGGFGQGPGQGGQSNAVGGGGAHAPATAATPSAPAAPKSPPAVAAMKELRDEHQQLEQKMGGDPGAQAPAERAALAPKPGNLAKQADKTAKADTPAAAAAKGAPSAKGAPAAEPPLVTGTPASPPEMSMAPSLTLTAPNVVYRTADPAAVARQIQKIAEASGAKFALLDESRRRMLDDERSKRAGNPEEPAAEKKAEAARNEGGASTQPRVYKIVVAAGKRESVLKQLRSLQTSLASNNAAAPSRSVARQSGGEQDAKLNSLNEAEDLKAAEEEERNDADNAVEILVRIEPLTAKD